MKAESIYNILYFFWCLGTVNSNVFSCIIYTLRIKRQIYGELIKRKEVLTICQDDEKICASKKTKDGQADIPAAKMPMIKIL